MPSEGRSLVCHPRAFPVSTAETARDFRQPCPRYLSDGWGIALVLGDGDIDPRRPRRRSESCWQLLNFRYRWLGATRLYFFISLRATFARNWGRSSRPCLALPPEQCVLRWRREFGCSPRFHARSADRSGGLGVLLPTANRSTLPSCSVP